MQGGVMTVRPVGRPAEKLAELKVRVDPEMRAALLEHCQAKNTTASAIVRKALTRYLREAARRS
jgi:Arc/MetJ family transcription regulator